MIEGLGWLWSTCLAVRPAARETIRFSLERIKTRVRATG